MNLWIGSHPFYRWHWQITKCGLYFGCPLFHGVIRKLKGKAP